jgi:hypothetical protein
MNKLKFELSVIENQYGVELYQLDIDSKHVPICTLFLETNLIKKGMFTEEQVILFILISHNKTDLIF